MGLESILLWNCRGIVSQERQRALINIVQQRKPTLVFLSETMAKEQHIKSLAMKLGFAGSFCVPSDEGCQGLALLWTAETQIIIRTHSFHHIDVEIGDSDQPPQFRFTGIYGWDARADRWKTWELIRKLGDEVCDLPWLMGGDFNEVLCRAHKSGGAPRATAAMLEFRHAMVDCALSDMGFLGSRYTCNIIQRNWALPITGLKDENGILQDNPHMIRQVMYEYYQKIFNGEGIDEATISDIFRATPTTVTSEMNTDLLLPYSNEEIREALFQMHPSKSPDSDGMSPFFFQKYWNIVVTYAILVNGKVTGIITPTRGIRQGDPLSPYLNILCTEGLSALLSQAVNSGVLKGLKMAPSAPNLHHLFFADDSLLFGNATLSECQMIRQLLNTYERTSGQQGDSETKKKIHWQSWEKLCLTKEEGGMGFKNLYAYNLALLAKQGWRFMCQPNSLVTRVFKARYFPTVPFQDAQLGDNPSYPWRSILEGRSVLQAGVKWRIGDGTKVSIWKDAWIPECPKYLIQKPPHTPYELVSDLLTPSKSWIEQLVHRLFHPQLANVMGNALASSSQGDGYKALWQKIWQAKVPGKVQVCVWRACQNLLPTRTRLTTKGYEGAVDCIICGHHYEDTVHLFCQCPIAKEVLSKLPGTMTWLEEFHKARHTTKTSKKKSGEKWTASSYASKLNVDGAFLPSLTQGGVGGILRDCNGSFIAAYSKPVHYVASAQHVELMAIRAALAFIKQQRLTNIIIESDCLVAVQDIQHLAEISVLCMLRF
ncbi:hypothetical protein ACLB2K_006726 [Fragaria x ananassa]